VTRLWQKHVQPLALVVEGGGMGTFFRRDLLHHRQTATVDYLDDRRLADCDVQPACARIPPDCIRLARDRYLPELAISGQVDNRDRGCVAGDKCALSSLI